MRRFLGGLLLALGVALLVLGMRAGSIYDRLATVPLDYKSTSVSQGANMNVLRVYRNGDVVNFDKLKGVTVQSTREVIGIPGKVPADKRDSTAFWQTMVTSTAVGVADLTYSNETVSFDRVSGTAVNCCGDQVSIGTVEAPGAMKDITHAGNYFKFPFNVQKQGYLWWDGDLEKATEAKFVRTENIAGTETYVFEQRIPDTQLSTSKVPAAVFDGTGDDVDATVTYSNVRTLWVEPVTGVIIKGTEAINKTVSSSLGTIDATKGNIGFDDKTITDNAQVWGAKASQLAFVRDRLGLVGTLGGLLLGALGAFLLITDRARRNGAHRGAEAAEAETTVIPQEWTPQG